MKILQYIPLHVENRITRILHHSAFHFWRYTHFGYAKCLFTYRNNRIHQKTAYFFFKKMHTSIIREFLGLRMRNFWGIISI